MARASQPIRRAVVIGGGLAGMTAAKELAKRDVRVTLLEGSHYLGGKATARPLRGHLEDHGFHIFAPWYVNTLALLEEIDCSRNLIPIRQTHFLHRGDYPRTRLMREWSSVWNGLLNVVDGALPWHEALLAYYFAMDLASEPYRRRAYLDRLSGHGFFRSRFYYSEAAANFHHQTVLQAAAVPYWNCSAMTLRRLFKAWLTQLSPCFSILDGNLRDRFIEPFAERLRALGVEVITDCRVVRLDTEGGRIRRLVCAGRERQRAPQLDAGSAVVLAVPHAHAWRLIDSHLLETEHRVNADRRDRRGGPVPLAGLGELISAPMAALHLHLNRRLSDLPKEHVNLVDSRYGTTLVDVAPHWGLEHSRIHLIAANFYPLMHLTQAEAKRFIVEELAEFVTELDPERDIESGVLQPHVNEPLFLNTIGAWAARPESVTAVDNLYMAGDYCRTDADLATMESAVVSGLNAAQAILRRCGKAPEIAPQPIPRPAPALLAGLRYAPLPAVLAIATAKRLQSEGAAWQEHWERFWGNAQASDV